MIPLWIGLICDMCLYCVKIIKNDVPKLLITCVVSFTASVIDIGISYNDVIVIQNVIFIHWHNSLDETSVAWGLQSCMPHTMRLQCANENTCLFCFSSELSRPLAMVLNRSFPGDVFPGGLTSKRKHSELNTHFSLTWPNKHMELLPTVNI